MATPTLLQLRTMVRTDLRDPDGTTFEDQTVTDFVNAGIAEISRIAPRESRQQIPFDPTVNQYSTLLVDAHRVEAWDTVAVPPTFFTLIPPQADNDFNSSQAGWEIWAGSLSIPSGWTSGLTPSRHSFVVWGWMGYAQLVNDTDVADFTDANLVWAVREYAAVAGFEYLMADRALFEQWATQANNTDVTPAALANMLSLWLSKWERRRKQLRTLRQLP